MWKNVVPISPRLIRHGSTLIRSRRRFDCVSVGTRIHEDFDSANTVIRQQQQRQRGRGYYSHGRLPVWPQMGTKVYPSSVDSVWVVHRQSYLPGREGVITQRRVMMTRPKLFTNNDESSPTSFRSLFRCFSSKDEEVNKEESNVENTAVASSNNNNNATTTDPVLVEYLAGGPPVTGGGGILGGGIPPKRRKRKKIVMIFEDEKELYQKIHRNQLLQKERSREKTAANVYRALIGNVVICCAKLGAWLSSGSSAMLSELIHSVVDCGNQSLLLIGLNDSRNAADRSHPYGYGKSIYFWALVSALGTFFLGAGVSMTNAVGELMNPSLHAISWEVWTVLLLSFTVDGYVLTKTLAETSEGRPEGVPYWKHAMNIRDPATLAVLLEDGAACLGIVIAIAGITASHVLGNPIYDGVAGVGISALLGAMGIALVRVNHRFLLGQAVSRDIVDDIGSILQARRSIDSIRSVQSQWTGPETFSYKAEVDFDGTYLAAKLMPVYQHEFIHIKDTMDEELQVLLSLYAEDVMRTVEREVRHVEAQIRLKYPGAEYIELEPMSVEMDRLAIDETLEGELRRVESDALNRHLKSLRKEADVSNARQQERASTPASPSA